MSAGHRKESWSWLTSGDSALIRRRLSPYRLILEHQMQKSHIEEQLTTSERWCQLWSGNIPQKRILEGLVPQADPKLRFPSHRLAQPTAWEGGERASADRRNPALSFRGADYSFDELSKLRGAAFAAECDLDVQRERHARSRAAIGAVRSEE